MKYGVLLLLLTVAAIRMSAQAVSAELYQAKVVLLNGKAVRGMLYEVSEMQVHLVEVGEEQMRYGNPRIPLTNIKRVVIRRRNRRSATITGAVIGGLATGYLVVRSARKNGFRSPVSYGLTLILGAGAGAGAGAVAGNKIGNTSRRVIRPVGRSPEAATENLRRQLEPFTFDYQNGFLNRAPQ